jgi:WD40 repeat protein
LLAGGSTFAGGGWLRSWNISATPEIKKIFNVSSPVTTIVFGKDYMASGDSDNGIVLRTLQGDVLSRAQAKGSIDSIALSEDGRWLATVEDKQVELWSVSDHKP